MKSGDQQLEHWQQESLFGMLKRFVFVDESNKDTESKELQEVPIRLSAEYLKRGCPPTMETCYRNCLLGTSKNTKNDRFCIPFFAFFAI